MPARKEEIQKTLSSGILLTQMNYEKLRFSFLFFYYYFVLMVVKVLEVRLPPRKIRSNDCAVISRTPFAKRKVYSQPNLSKTTYFTFCFPFTSSIRYCLNHIILITPQNNKTIYRRIASRTPGTSCQESVSKRTYPTSIISIY